MCRYYTIVYVWIERNGTYPQVAFSMTIFFAKHSQLREHDKNRNKGYYALAACEAALKAFWIKPFSLI